MSSSRREFVTLASAALATGVVARPVLGAPASFNSLDIYPHAGDPVLKELAAKALEAATGAGASYADVRFTLTRTEEIRGGSDLGVNDEHGAVGVRAFADGAWGFAASPVWTADEAARLGREATVMAKTNARVRRRRIDLGDPPPVVTGTWRTPIVRDPFSVPLAEKFEVMRSFGEVPTRFRTEPGIELSGGMNVLHRRQEKTFASTIGSFTNQTTFVSMPSYGVSASSARLGRQTGAASEELQPIAGGWEVISQSKLMDEIPKLVDTALLLLNEVPEPVQPDRYDIIFDAYAMAQLVARTVGVAMELDRALGYEANAGGTSYLALPEEKLGTFVVGSPLLNVTANRSQPGGLATVQWDDEGVAPEEYTLVKDGVVADYHTTRELVGTLAPWYAKTGHAARSHGCASADTAKAITILHTPNIAMQPGTDAATFDDMIAGMDKGLVIRGARVSTDRQQLNGEIGGAMVYEVRKGKRTNFVRGAECLFRTPEFWKNLKAIGGPGTQRWTGIVVTKGQPQQRGLFSAAGVPALVKGVAVTDALRKA